MRAARAKAITPALLVLLACIALAGCKQEEDAQTAGDNSRGKAQLTQIGFVVTDVLSPELGDHTDWKSFAIPASGVLAIRVYWDSADKIRGGVVTIHDKYGIQLAERVHDPLVAIDELLIRVDKGYYFLRLHADKGDSIYSLQAQHLLVTPTGEETDEGSIPVMAQVLEIEGLGPADAEAGAEAAIAPVEAAPAGGGGAAFLDDNGAVEFGSMNLDVIAVEGLVEESVESAPSGGGGGGGGGGAAMTPPPPDPIPDPVPVAPPEGAALFGGSPSDGGGGLFGDPGGGPTEFGGGMDGLSLGGVDGGAGPGGPDETAMVVDTPPTPVHESVEALVVLVTEEPDSLGESRVKFNIGSTSGVYMSQGGVIKYVDSKKKPVSFSVDQVDSDFSWATVKVPASDLVDLKGAELHDPR